LTSEKSTDIGVVAASVFFLPIATRVPLKFGHETLTSVTCCRICVKVRDRKGREAIGWGETPLSVQWAWPATLAYAVRNDAMKQFSIEVAEKWADQAAMGHPLELAYDFQQQVLPKLLDDFNALLPSNGMPYLAALICSSAFDIALHDAYGKLHEIDIYQSYSSEYMNRDLSAFIAPADDVAVDFSGTYPSDYLLENARPSLPVWHLVGGLDPLTFDDCSSDQRLEDEYPVVLSDWIRTDGLKCLKVKLRGNDSKWDYRRLVQVGELGFPLGVEHLSADFNCTVERPKYVNDILDRLRRHHAEVFDKILYVEQPFPYELSENSYDVRSVSERKPLFLDESAHDWTYVRLGRSLGWSGVALKTCKTQSGSLLSYCWAKTHGMQVMVQDLSNPMLAQIPHVRLAANVDTIMGVESNSMQFYPRASLPEAAVHPGIYNRRHGRLNLESIQGSGFGYRIGEINRNLPAPAATFGNFYDA
jgi:L-alanine-DL-glutamate epimerase-like enolase superfamily enzyme